MWRDNGTLENYVYHAGQRSRYGDDEYWNANAQPGTWHRIQHRIVMNTPGVANGIVEAWLDGIKVLSITKLTFRNTADIGINLFYFSTFYGGNDASWAPAEDQYAYFDNFRIATDSEIPDNARALALNDEASSKISKDSGGGTASFLSIFLMLLIKFTVKVLARRK